MTRLAGAVSRIGEYKWPIELTPTTRQFLDGVTELTGVEFDPDDPDKLLKELGTVARFVGATLQNTTNPTLLKGGYKHNVIPGIGRGPGRLPHAARARRSRCWKSSANSPAPAWTSATCTTTSRWRCRSPATWSIP